MSWQFLANDLIFEILRHFLPGLQLSMDQPDLFPWYLGNICSTWRTVFISSPQFWSTLNIDVDVFLEKELLPYRHGLVKLVQLALKRSNGHPLSLNTHMSQVFKADDAPLRMCANNILDMLVDHSIYWRDISMMLDRSCFPTLYRAKNRLPILRSIRLTPSTRRTHHDIVSDSIKFEDLFTNATQLSRVYFLFMSYWRLNWSSVTVLHLVNLLWFDELIPILRQTGVLEELVIVIIHSRMDPSGTSPVHLPFLKMLYLPTLMPLSLLHTPGLEELYVRHGHRPINDLLDMELLNTTLSGYFKTVRNLRKLSIYPKDLGHALPVLEAAPDNTRELALHGNFVSKQLKFAANCPRLHNLKTISIETRSHEIPYLLAMVKAWAQERQSTTEGGIGPFKNLAHLSLDFVPDRNGGILKLVKRLERVFEGEGINFVSRIITELDISTYGAPPFDLL